MASAPTDEPHERVIRRIRSVAKQRGWSVNKLADFADVGRGYLSDVLAGKKSPTLRTLVKISRALDTDVREFFV